jgi:hypothetical protein
MSDLENKGQEMRNAMFILIKFVNCGNQGSLPPGSHSGLLHPFWLLQAFTSPTLKPALKRCLCPCVSAPVGEMFP